jgi:hypothetical protein
MLKNYEGFAEALASLTSVKDIPYSGIIMTRHPDIADPAAVEASCYRRGGLRFLYRSYVDPAVNVNEFPIHGLLDVLNRVVRLYMADIIKATSAGTYIDSCWAVCQRAGDYATLHNHGTDLYSGIFYLTVPPAINPNTFPDGCLHLVEGQDVSYVPPVPGGVTMWHGSVLHAVHPFRGEGDRLAIAFNFKKTESNLGEN